MNGQQLGLVVKIHHGPSSIKIRRTDKKDDGDLPSAALCSSIPAPIKPDSLLRLNAVLIIIVRVERRMVSERPANLESCRAAECIAYVLVTEEEMELLLFVPKYAQGEAS